MRIFVHEVALCGVAPEAAWMELARLLRDPASFTPGCESVSVKETVAGNGSTRLVRTKRFGGGLAIQDTVDLKPPRRALVTVEAGPSWPRSTQSIEALPDKVGSKLVFVYEQDTKKKPEDTPYERLRREAYRQADEALAALVCKAASQ